MRTRSAWGASRLMGMVAIGVPLFVGSPLAAEIINPGETVDLHGVWLADRPDLDGPIRMLGDGTPAHAYSAFAGPGGRFSGVVETSVHDWNGWLSIRYRVTEFTDDGSGYAIVGLSTEPQYDIFDPIEADYFVDLPGAGRAVPRVVGRVRLAGGVRFRRRDRERVGLGDDVRRERLERPRRVARQLRRVRPRARGGRLGLRRGVRTRICRSSRRRERRRRSCWRAPRDCVGRRFRAGVRGRSPCIRGEERGPRRQQHALPKTVKAWCSAPAGSRAARARIGPAAS